MISNIPSFSRRHDCRLCGSRALEKVFALAPTPPANAFVAASALNDTQEVYPLDVFLCRHCTHLQLCDVIDPRLLFENYVYVSGISPVFVRHFERYAADGWAMIRGKAGDLVVDIGSNDGTLLRVFQKLGARTLGIDPARDIASAATAEGIETLQAFFDVDVAERIVAERGHAQLVTANNVFAHADNLSGITAGVQRLLSEDGLFMFEVSYLVDVIRKTLFDTIYHEHLAYHSVRPLIPFLATHGLELIEAIRVDSHGGSLRGVAQRVGGPRPTGKSVAAALSDEAELGLQFPETYRAFYCRIEKLGRELSELLQTLKSEGARIAGFGAPAKATTLMYQFGLGCELIDYIVDDSPIKQGLYSPGKHIAVVPATMLSERPPDYLVILAWNFADAIIEKNKLFRDRGGKFIVPIPHIEVV